MFRLKTAIGLSEVARNSFGSEARVFEEMSISKPSFSLKIVLRSYFERPASVLSSKMLLQTRREVSSTFKRRKLFLESPDELLGLIYLIESPLKSESTV